MRAKIIQFKERMMYIKKLVFLMVMVTCGLTHSFSNIMLEPYHWWDGRGEQIPYLLSL